MRVAPEVVLTASERAELTRLARPGASDDRLAQRARIVLLAAQGLQNKEIAALLKVGRVQVARWRERFLRMRRAGLEGDPARGAPLPPAPTVPARQAAPDRRFDIPLRLGTPAGESLRDELTAFKRDRILQEASRLFYERGYAQTSVDAIAERVGATKPFIYSRYGSKVDLLVEVCERSNREALDAAERALSGAGSPRERFLGFMLEFTDVVLRLHQHVAIYFREQSNLPPEAAERIDGMRKSISSRLALLLAEGEQAREMDVGDTRMAALVIAGMSSYAFAWYRDDGRLERHEVAHRIAQMALKVVSPSLPPPSTAG